ncbi:MAG: TlpA family protein disulfide reductase [Bryobacterales bacterium]|nr:TlpA family protein disulfide reductase [Bryobacterales bacterium]MBV9399753.1 TlpA family protein disulfide reductase [Bryobacterales bacterium]
MKLLTRFAIFAALGVSAFASGAVPRHAPEFDFVDASGKHTLLSSYKGKVVLIQFLLTTCPHCQAMSQMLTKLQSELGPRGFQAVGVVYNDPEPGGKYSKADMAKDYQAGYSNNGKERMPFGAPLNFPIFYAPMQTMRNFMEASVMDRLMFPHVVIVDKKGEIVNESKMEGSAELQSEASLRELIDKLLKEGGAPASSKAAPKKAAAVATTTK